MTPRLCIAIHDVAPATWPQCERLLALLDGCGAPPLTLLVVPDFHRRGRIDADAAFRRGVEARLARGDEVALHGYFHLDEAPPQASPAQWLRRRLLTAGEGEFAALAQADAARRIGDGLELFARLGWRAHGFVAPAWLLGDGARAALRESSLRYTSTHAHLEIIADGRRVSAPAISASARSAWRRWSSRRWLAAAAAFGARAPLLRLALHPADAQHADLLDAWRSTVRKTLDGRVALTKSAALGLA